MADDKGGKGKKAPPPPPPVMSFTVRRAETVYKDPPEAGQAPSRDKED